MSRINLHQRITNRDDDSINAYFRDMSIYPLLTADEEKELAKKALSGDQVAKDKLITSNLRFVVTVAKQYQGKGLSLVDLIQEGNKGLINSIEKFDPDKGFRFMSYAIWWVRQAIIQALSNNSRMIRVPYTKATNLYKILVKKGQFEQTNGREPTLEELSKITNIEIKQIQKILDAPKSCVSLESPFSTDDESGCLLDITPNKDANSSSNLDKEDLNHLIHLMINSMDDRTYDILVMFFGLDGVEQMSLKDIGARFNFTEERARQLKNKALKQCKELYSDYIKENGFL